MYIEILYLIGLLILSGIFSATETAFFSFSRVDLLTLKKSDSARFRLVYRMMQKPNEVLTSLLLGNNFVNIMIVVVGSQLWSRLVPYIIQGTARHTSFFEITNIFLKVLLLSGLLVFGGEIFPKSFALKHPTSVARWVASPFFIFHQFLGWTKLRFLASFVSKRLMKLSTRLLGKTEENATPEDIQIAVDLGEQDGHLSLEEANIVRNILAIQDIQVSHLMIHRSWIHTLSPEARVSEAIRLGIKNKWPQYPVYDVKKDEVVGIFDVEKAFYNRQQGRVHQFMRPPVFVSTVKSSEFLMDMLWENKNTLVVVVDEFGAYLGVLSTREMMEYLVKMGGVKSKEISNSLRGVTLLEKGWQVDGTTWIEDLENTLKTSLPRGDFRTVAGLLEWESGIIPQKGSCIVIHGWKFYIEKAELNRVISIFVPHK